MLSRRRLLASLALAPIAIACQQRFPDPPKSAAPAITTAATATPSEPRKVRIALPNQAAFLFWVTRLQNLNNRLDPARNVRLTTTPVDVGTADVTELPARYAQALAALPQAEAPDLVLSGPEQFSVLGALATAGVSLDLNPIVKAERWFKSDDFIGNVLKTGIVQGKQVALPMCIGVECTLFNRKTFDTGNISAPPVGWTWDQFLATAKALTRPARGDEPARWGFLVGAGPTLPTLAWQHGSELVTEDGARVTLGEPGTIAAMEMLVDLIQTHKVAPPLAAGDQFWNAWSSLGRQEVAMAPFFAGGAVWWRTREEMYVAEVPTLPQGKVVLGTTPLMLGIPKNAPDQAHSLNALRSIFDASNASMFLPPRKGVDDLRKTDSLMTASDADALASALGMARFLPGDAPSALGPMIDAEFTQPILRGEKKPAQAAKDAQPLIDEALKKVRG